MITEFKLSGPVPSKKNSRINFRTRRGKQISLPGEAYAKWHRVNLPMVRKVAKVAELDPKKRYVVSVRIEFKDRRRRDLDNAMSSILDLLVDGGLLPDDCWNTIPEQHITGEHGALDGVWVKIIQKIL